MSAQKSDNALLRELSTRQEAMAGQQFPRAQVSLGMNPQALFDKVKGLATERLDVALCALKAQSAADAQAYGDC